MNFKSLANKTVTGAVALGMVAASSAPAFAVSDDIFEPIADTGLRVTLDDTGTDLADLYVDFNVREGVEGDAFDLGTLYIYGDDEDDVAGANSFEDIIVQAGNTNLNNGLTRVGMVIKNSSDASDPEFLVKVLVQNGAAGDLYAYSPTEDEDDVMEDTWAADVDNLIDDAIAAGVTGAGDLATWTDLGTTGYTDTSNYLQGTISDTSTVQKGETERVAKFVDEVYLYFENNDSEYYGRVNLEYGGDLMDATPDPVENLRVVARGTRGRVEFTPPAVMDGLAGFEVDFDNTAQGTDRTLNTVLFFDTETDTEYDVEVGTFNMEGTVDNEVTASADSDYGGVDANLSDVAGTTFETWIDSLYALSIIDGFSDGTYRPEELVTRGQLSKFVFNTFEPPFDIKGEAFPDVPSDNVFFPYVMSLKNAGIVGGFSDGTFKPDQTVTRGEAMTFTFRAATYFDEDVVDESGTGCFPDVAGSVHATSICALANHNDDDFAPIVGGYSNGDFGPNDALTRGAMAKIMLNAAALIEKVDLTTGDDASFIGVTANEGLGTATGVNFTAGYTFAYGDLDRDADVADDAAVDYTFNFIRPFVAPKEVEGLEVSDESTIAVQLEWDDLYADDASVDGYVIERRDSGSDDTAWDVLDNGQISSYDAVAATVDVTVNAAPSAAADNVSLVLAGNEYEVDFAGTETTTDTAAAVATALNKADGFTVTNAAAVITITSDIPGVDFAFSLTETGTLDYDTNTGTATGTAGTAIVDGYVPALAASTTTGTLSIVDTDVDAGDSYEYRITAIKVVPYSFVSDPDEYDNMAEMVANGELENILMNSVYSGWEMTSVSVPNEDEV